MNLSTRFDTPWPAGARLAAGCCVLAALAWLSLLVVAAHHDLWKLPLISSIAAAAMLVGAGVAIEYRTPRVGGALDAVAGGAMFASALIYLVPKALSEHPLSGGLGLVFGVAIGFSLRWPHARARTPMLGALTLHAASAGLVMGLVYTRMPALGLPLGLAIVSHKLPAGYVLARNLQSDDRPRYPVIIPALATGLTALPIALWKPGIILPTGLLFGFASGLFILVASISIGREYSRSDSKKYVYAALCCGAGVIVTLEYTAHVLG